MMKSVQTLPNYYSSWQRFAHLGKILTAVASCSKRCFWPLLHLSVPLNCLLWTVYCLAMHLTSFAHHSAVYCLRFIVHFLLVTVFFELSIVFCLLYSLYCLLFTAYFFGVHYFLPHITSLKLLPCKLFTVYLLQFAIYYPISTIPTPHAVDQGQMLQLIFLTPNSKCNYIFMQEGISFQL